MKKDGKVISEGQYGGLTIQKRKESDLVAALAGNPNVGKSTVFNALTGMRQHTGNWPGKTVSNAAGYCRRENQGYVLVDLPGCYSLMAHSKEEEAARDFICFGQPDLVVVVCDATCLERNLNLVLQILEAESHVAVCVNLMDEAAKKKIHVDLEGLSARLKVPVVGTAARSSGGLNRLFDAMDTAVKSVRGEGEPVVVYPEVLENAVAELEQACQKLIPNPVRRRFICARLLDGDDCLLQALKLHLEAVHRAKMISGEDGEEEGEWGALERRLTEIQGELAHQGYDKKKIGDMVTAAFVGRAEQISSDVVTFDNHLYDERDRRLDRLFTSRKTGFPLMFLMLLLVFWITICGANMPSRLLSEGLFWVEDRLMELSGMAGIPSTVSGPLILGIYRVLAWVVSVMLPPMAIFFPLFTLLEDFGYLPRVAFNLDYCFKRCHACGKQALTMCMGFGCNAAGVTGCRIIDSPRERLIAILTNNFVPCNGRFPTILSVITMFLIGGTCGFGSTFLSAVFLAGVIVFGILMTFLVSSLLSKTVLRGIPSSFALELPPYRRPQVGKVIVRSIFDRTLFVLGRAVCVAAPAGLVIWMLANITVGGDTLLVHCSSFLDPLGKLMGLDGVILLAFILGMPANEIVVPIMLMTYLAQGSILDIGNLSVLKELLTANGWTWITAVCMILFSLMHWPCGTTILTIHKETQSVRWTVAAVLIPTLMGMILCMAFAGVTRVLECV